MRCIFVLAFAQCIIILVCFIGLYIYDAVSLRFCGEQRFLFCHIAPLLKNIYIGIVDYFSRFSIYYPYAIIIFETIGRNAG